MDLALRRQCVVLHRGRSVAEEGTPLSATDRIEEEIPHVKPNFFIYFFILLRLYVLVNYGLNTEANFVLQSYKRGSMGTV